MGLMKDLSSKDTKESVQVSQQFKKKPKASNIIALDHLVSIDLQFQKKMPGPAMGPKCVKAKPKEDHPELILAWKRFVAPKELQIRKLNSVITQFVIHYMGYYWIISIVLRTLNDIDGLSLLEENLVSISDMIIIDLKVKGFD